MVHHPTFMLDDAPYKIWGKPSHCWNKLQDVFFSFRPKNLLPPQSKKVQHISRITWIFSRSSGHSWSSLRHFADTLQIIKSLFDHPQIFYIICLQSVANSISKSCCEDSIAMFELTVDRKSRPLFGLVGSQGRTFAIADISFKLSGSR